MGFNIRVCAEQYDAGYLCQSFELGSCTYSAWLPRTRPSRMYGWRRGKHFACALPTEIERAADQNRSLRALVTISDQHITIGQIQQSLICSRPPALGFHSALKHMMIMLTRSLQDANITVAQPSRLIAISVSSLASGPSAPPGHQYQMALVCQT